MSGHVDISQRVDAPVEVVWSAANDPAEWQAAQHPVEVLRSDDERLQFRVTVPAETPDGETLTYLVDRVHDSRNRTVYSRRYQSSEFLYSHVWFEYSPDGDGTVIRCVVDFEMRPGHGPDSQMEERMRTGLQKNLRRTAERITQQAKEES